MRKLFTFLVAFLATVSGAVWGQYTAEININSPGGDYYYKMYNQIILPGGSGANYYIYGNGSVSNTRVQINGDCTITLENVNINRESGSVAGTSQWANNLGRPFALADANVKLILKGENRIESVEGDLLGQDKRAGIYVPEGSTLTIAEESTGSLYAKGSSGIGSQSGDPSGSIIINGGSVTADGNPGIGGTEGGTNVTIEGNTFVVLKGGVTGMGSVNPNTGIIVNDRRDPVEDRNKAYVYGDVELKSPFWEGYPLHFTDGSSLSLMKGVTLPVTALADVDKAHLNAYQVHYTSNYQEGDTGGQDTPGSNYLGSETMVSELPILQCKGEEGKDKHISFGWVEQTAGTFHGTSYTTPANKASGVQEVHLIAMWAESDRTLTITEDGFKETKLLCSPANAGITYKLQDAQELPSGIELDADGITLKGSYNETTSKDVLFDIYVGKEKQNATATVHFDYTPNIEITGASINENATYTGYNLLNAIKVTARNKETQETVNVTLGVQYKVSTYTYTAREGSENRNPADDEKLGKIIREAGTYSGLKIELIPGSAVTFADGFDGTVTGGDLTVKPYNIDVTSTTSVLYQGDSKWNIDYALSQAVGEQQAKAEGKLGLESGIDVAGVQNITLGTLKLVDNTSTGFYANNYDLVTSKLGTIKVLGNIVTGYTVSITGGDKLEYNGSEQKDQIQVSVTSKDGGTPLDKQYYNVYFELKKDTKLKAAASEPFKNVGTYYVHVEGKGDYYGDIRANEERSISPKPITAIKAANQTIKIGENINTTASKETVIIEGLVETESPTYAGTIVLNPDVDVNVADTYENTLSIESLTITDNAGFLKSNYSGWDSFTNKYGTGTLTVTDDSGIDIDIPEEGEIEVDENGNVSFPYDGKNHNNFFADKKITVKYKEGEKEETLELGTSHYQVTWKKDNFKWSSTEEPWSVGAYVATITITKTDIEAIKGKFTIKTLTVKNRALTAVIKNQTIDTPESPTEFNAEGNVTISNTAEGETAVLTGKLKVNASGLQEGHIYKGAIVKENFTLTDGTGQNGFKAANYELKDEKITAGDLTVKQATNPTDPEDIIPGDGDNDWTWDPTQNAYTMTYDGLEHGITQLKVKFTDSENNVSYQVVKVTATYQPNVTPKEYVDGGYTATVSIPENEYIKNGTASLKLMILKRDMTLDFHLPQSLTEGETPNWNAKTAITFTNLANPKGKEETPTIKDECRLVIENGKAVLKGYPYIVDNAATGFKMNNYTVDYKNNGQDITIDPDGDGDVEIPEIPVNPDEGGDGGDGQDPTKYYNIYDVTEYDFIDVSFSRHVVSEGGSINVYLEIPEGLDPAAVSLMFKRSLYGGWENLNTDDDGNYLINNIWTDIYVKAVVDESYIDPNPDENHIYIDLSETNDSIWLYTERKLVEEGKTAVIQAEVAKSCQNKEIRYMYKRTVLGEWKEMPKDYSINQYVVRDITTDIYVKAYFVFDKQDPTTAKNPHHVYADITATCEGLYLDATRHKVADEGDTKVFLYVKKGFETKDARYQFKRGLKGEWEDLVPGIEQNTFQVTDIEGDIYLKGMDAVYTGTEDIDGMVRVYTKDGSLFVYTAQPEEISVVSMTGVTVKRTRQTGLQSYPLNQGIYVVCVGEQVFKVRVK